MERKRVAQEVIKVHKQAAVPSATSMLPAAKVEELLSKLRGKSTGQSSEGLPMPESKQMPSLGPRPTRTAEEQDEFFARLAAAGRHGRPKVAAEEAANLPSFDLRPLRSAEEQKEYFDKLSVPRVVRPKVLPFELGHRVQSSFGLASERHLLGRLEQLHLSKQKALMEKEEQEAQARVQEVRRALYGDDVSDDETCSGIFPPDPSPEASEAE